MSLRDGVVTFRKPPEERTIKYDNLNGENTVQSMLQLSKAGAIIGSGVSASHLCLFFPKNFADGALRAANITGTFVVLGAVFGMTTNVSASLRHKDDPLNYFIGGCATGLILGAKMKSYSVGSGSCLAFGAWSAFYKKWMIEGYGKFLKPPTY